jgi:outer membrane biogenesis lipoprotein LolB
MKALVVLFALILLTGCTVVLKAPHYVLKHSDVMSDEVVKYIYYDVQGNCPPVVIYSTDTLPPNHVLMLVK